MFVKLTNASPVHKGKTVVLNTEVIISVVRVEIARDENKPDEKEELTYVYCPPHGTWEVEETPDEIAKLLNIN